MELIHHLALGLSVAATPANLAYCLAGVSIATLIGVLPGLGPVATVSILLPLTFHLPPISALIMLSGIYYGSMYGGSTSAILINLPGEASHVVTAIDGYPLAQQGRAGAALGMAALASFFGGMVSNILVALFAPPLANVAIEFGSVEFFSLMLVGLISAVVLAHGSVLKAIAMTVFGLLVGMVGTDVNSGDLRFTFGIDQLANGVSFVVVAIGVFGFAQIVSNLSSKESKKVIASTVKGIMPTYADFKAVWRTVLRGTALGSALGLLPGTGATISAFAAYSVEKRLAKDPARFGKGAIEGVAAPECANNAAAQTHFIPMLVLGIPPGPTLAVLLGAMIMQGIDPGPQVISSHPDLFWGIIVSMWIGNFFLVILNLPLIPIWVRILTIPYRLLYPTILLLACVGVFSLKNSAFNVILASAFGLLGYLFIKLECEPAPLMLGLILGPMMEQNLRRGLLLSRGDLSVFFTHPISLAMLLIAALVLIFVSFGALKRLRGGHKTLRGRLTFDPVNGKIKRWQWITIINTKDFYAGLMFAFFGVIAVVVARNYEMGTLRQMGPGYFPTILGSLLIFLGLIIIMVQALFPNGSCVTRFAVRPMIFVLGSVAAFGLLLGPVGLVVSTFVLIVVSRLGGYEFRPVGVIISYLVLIVAAWVIFVYGLGLPIHLWPH